MNPGMSREEHEAQLTALILGELTPEHAFALGRAIEQDAELAKVYERLKLTIALVRETAASPVEQTAAQPAPLKLSDKRREELLQRFKTVKPKEFAKPPGRNQRLVEVAAAMVILAILAAISFPSLSRNKKGSVTTATDKTLADMAANTALERAKAEMIGRIATENRSASLLMRRTQL